MTSDIHVALGNNAPHQKRHEFDAGTTHDLGITVADPSSSEFLTLDRVSSNTTFVTIDASTEYNQAVKNVVELWKHHSKEVPGWIMVSSTRSDEENKDLETALRVMLGVPRPTGPVALVTNAGLDFASKQLSGAASATAVAKWVALTANSAAAGATDTTLTGEIVTAGGGLVRVATTYAHTAAASTYTLTNTFTANGSDTLPVTVAKAGCFDASTAGNMVYETLISPTATYNASGDNMPLTWTITV